MLRTASIVPEDDDLTERRTSAREDIARKLAVEKEKWERSRERERRLAERILPALEGKIQCLTYT